MNYVASVRVGQNDIKALINLTDEDKKNVIPLLSMRGRARHLDNFLEAWGDFPFFLDVSPFPADTDDAFIEDNGLWDPTAAYALRQQFYLDAKGKNNNVIPTISWKNDHAPRDTVQFALALERDFDIVAVRVNLTEQDGDLQRIRLLNMLNALADLEKVWVLLDCGPISQTHNLYSSSLITNTLTGVRDLRLAGISVLSTSFPDNRPASGTIRTIPSLDLAAQSRLVRHVAPFSTAPTYGDYAATNPSGSMEYIPGMQIIPFANYFANGEWWQARRGGDREFSAYVDIASDITQLPGFHGTNFCWANSEINRIASNTGGNGNNGTWNGLRINQHICAMIDYLSAAGFPTRHQLDDEDE